MTRFKLTIEYNGAPFSGWQRQNDRPSVQQAIEDAVSALDQAPTQVFGAGRTDAGVHALGQVAHFDLVKDLPASRVRDALNHHLKTDAIAILSAEAVHDAFNARFDAIERTYLYRIIDRRPPLTLERGKIWRIPRKLDVDAMHECAQVLIGRHDFTTFRDTMCQAKTPIRTMDEIRVSRIGAEIHLFFRARSYLHRQVRSITGSLVETGIGKWSKADMRTALEAHDHAACGPVAPAEGLYLNTVLYPDLNQLGPV